MKDAMEMDSEGLSLHAPNVEDLSDWGTEQLARELDRARVRLAGRKEALRLDTQWIEEDEQAIARIEAELAKRVTGNQH